MGVRWYDPQLGRWISPDTIIPDPANPQALNRYSYVNNRPLVYVDPSGHYATVEDNDYSLDDCLNNGGCIYPQGHDRAGHIILWTEEQKDRIARNRAFVSNVGKTVLAVLWEPADWAMTFNQWRQGNFSLWDLLGVLPILSSQMDDAWDVLHAADRAGMDEAAGTLRAGQGGRFADLDALGEVGDNLTPHHMPQKALGWTSEADGGALVMTHAEHAQTRTYWWRGRQTAIEDAGRSFRDVLATDIQDVRSIVGSRYNEGLRDVINYYRTNFPDLMKKR
jgi:hypothetical protein